MGEGIPASKTALLCQQWEGQFHCSAVSRRSQQKLQTGILKEFEAVMGEAALNTSVHLVQDFSPPR